MGGTAAAISKTGAAPIERVKLLVQNQGAILAAGRLDKPYGGVVDCFKRTYVEEGLVSCTCFFPVFCFKSHGIEACYSLAGKRYQRHTLLSHASLELCVQGHI